MPSRLTDVVPASSKHRGTTFTVRSPAPAVVSKAVTLATAALRSDLSGAAGELDSATTAFPSGDYGDAALYDVWFRLVLAHRCGGSALWRPMLSRFLTVDRAATGNCRPVPVRVRSVAAPERRRDLAAVGA